MSWQERRLEFEPGYGPTKWLWPTAAKYPRTYVGGGTLLLVPGTGTLTAGGPGHALGIVSPGRSPPSTPYSP